MQTLFLSASSFWLKSSWTGTLGADGDVRYTTPSTARRFVTFGASALPSGARVLSALLSVRASIGYTGGALAVNGSEALSQDVTALLRPDEGGAYPDLTLPFSFRANGGAGGTGGHLSSTHVTEVLLTLTYETAGEMDAQAAGYRELMLKSARALCPRLTLIFPDGSMQAVGPEGLISFRLDEGRDDGLLFGTATAAMLTLRLANPGRCWYPGGSLRVDRPLLGATLRLALGVRAEDGVLYRPLGDFQIEEMSGDEDAPWLEVRGYDAMANALEAPFTDPFSYPATLSSVLDQVIAATGFPVRGVLKSNRDFVVRRRPDWGEGATFRKAIAWLCAAGGSFASIAPDGALRIADAWTEAPADALSLTPARYFRLAHDERAFRLRHLTVYPLGVTQREKAFRVSLDESAPE
ncbi:MAG: hypothetical protein IJ240_07230, partial [Clostridia bacterium]|nr:hypothetical protein [Clostridia bacterium]